MGWARVPFWDLSGWKNRRIPAKYVDEWPRMVCMAWRWLGTRDIHFAAEWIDWDDLLDQTWHVYDEADIVVGHNIDAFDTKMLAGEWLQAGMDPPAPWRSVDTYKVARRRFGFESMTLNSLCERLGIEGKQGEYDAEQVADALAGDAKAQAAVEAYNKGDVVAAEEVYLSLRGWAPNHPNLGVYTSDSVVCSHCQSDDIQWRGYRDTNTGRTRRYQCNQCGGWSTTGTRESKTDLRSI